MSISFFFFLFMPETVELQNNQYIHRYEIPGANRGYVEVLALPRNENLRMIILTPIYFGDFENGLLERHLFAWLNQDPGSDRSIELNYSMNLYPEYLEGESANSVRSSTEQMRKFIEAVIEIQSRSRIGEDKDLLIDEIMGRFDFDDDRKRLVEQVFQLAYEKAGMVEVSCIDTTNVTEDGWKDWVYGDEGYNVSGSHRSIGIDYAFYRAGQDADRIVTHIMDIDTFPFNRYYTGDLINVYDQNSDMNFWLNPLEMSFAPDFSIAVQNSEIISLYMLTYMNLPRLSALPSFTFRASLWNEIGFMDGGDDRYEAKYLQQFLYRFEILSYNCFVPSLLTFDRLDGAEFGNRNFSMLNNFRELGGKFDIRLWLSVNLSSYLDLDSNRLIGIIGFFMQQRNRFFRSKLAQFLDGADTSDFIIAWLMQHGNINDLTQADRDYLSYLLGKIDFDEVPFPVNENGESFLPDRWKTFRAWFGKYVDIKNIALWLKKEKDIDFDDIRSRKSWLYGASGLTLARIYEEHRTQREQRLSKEVVENVENFIPLSERLQWLQSIF